MSLIGYDLIPMVAADTVTDGMAANFARYLSIVKHADRVSAISRRPPKASVLLDQWRKSEGLPQPEVVAHPLPSEAPSFASETIVEARRVLGVGVGPVILVVGSHEPRKNHLAILEAAERLWVGGATFDLLFLGGSGWKGEEFDQVVDSLVTRRRRIIVRRRCSEDELWAAYSFARFTVFPSLLEGFGLPVVESLAAGTPVITSYHGSMAEIAEDGGGCLVVDPRDVDALEAEMERLLTDDQLLERLRVDAAARPRRTWREYADGVWSFLVEGRQLREVTSESGWSRRVPPSPLRISQIRSNALSTSIIRLPLRCRIRGERFRTDCWPDTESHIAEPAVTASTRSPRAGRGSLTSPWPNPR